MKKLIVLIYFFAFTTITVYAQIGTAVQLFKSDYRDSYSVKYEEVEPFIVKDSYNNRIGLVYTELSHSQTTSYIPKPWYWGGLSYVNPQFLMNNSSEDFLASQLYIISNDNWVLINRSNASGGFSPNSDFWGTWRSFKSTDNGTNWSLEQSYDYISHQKSVRNYSTNTVNLLTCKHPVTGVDPTIQYRSRASNGTYGSWTSVAPGSAIKRYMDICLNSQGNPIFCYRDNNYATLKFKSSSGDPVTITQNLYTEFNNEWGIKLSNLHDPAIAFHTSAGVILVVYSDYDESVELNRLYYSVSSDEGLSWSEPDLVYENTVDAIYPTLAVNTDDNCFYLSFLTIQSNDQVKLNMISYYIDSGNFEITPSEIASLGDWDNDGSHNFPYKSIHSLFDFQQNHRYLYIAVPYFESAIDVDVALYRLEIPSAVYVSFYNMINGTNNIGQLSLDSGEPFNSGSSELLETYSDHNVKTLQKVYQDQKHNNWNGDNAKYKLVHEFQVMPKDPDRFANYVEIDPTIAIQTQNNVSAIDFKDPWFIEADDSQPGNWKTYASPFTPGAGDDANYIGVFLHQNPTFSSTKPIYHLKAPSIVGTTSNIMIFDYWSAVGAEFDNNHSTTTENHETDVVFKQADATVTAVYRPINMTDSPLTLGPNSNYKYLSIPTGANIQMPNDFKIIVEADDADYENKGILDLSAATETNPITFRSVNTNPSAGTWKGIEFRKKSLTTFNLEHVKVYDAEAGLCFIGNPADETYTYPKIKHCEFKNNLVGVKYKDQDHTSGVGGDLYLYVDSCRFENNTVGLALDNTGRIVKRIRWNQFVDNEYGIYIEGYANSYVSFYNDTHFDICNNTILSDQADIGIAAIGAFYVNVEKNVIDIGNTGTGILIGKPYSYGLDHFRPSILGSAPESYLYEEYDLPGTTELIYRIHQNTVIGGYRGIQCHNPSGSKSSIRDNIVVNQKKDPENAMSTGAGILSFFLSNNLVGYNLVYGQESYEEDINTGENMTAFYYNEDMFYPLGQYFPSTDIYNLPANLTANYTPTYNSPVIDKGDPDFDRDGTSWITDVNDRDPDATRLDIGAFYYPQISVSGTISTNTTWYGKVTVTGDITVASGAELTIDPGTKVAFNSGKKITVNGEIDVNGLSSAKVVFTRSDTSSTSKTYWYGISIPSGGTFNFDHFEMYGASNGIYPNYGAGSISNGYLCENNYGIRPYYTNNLSVSNCELTGNNYGIYALGSSNMNVSGTQITSSTYGVRQYASSIKYTGCTVENNISGGINILDQSNINMDVFHDYEHIVTNNIIRNNGTFGISVSANTVANLGTYFDLDTDIEGGFNIFTHAASAYDIRSYKATAIPAQVNQWTSMNNYGTVTTAPTATSLGYTLSKSVSDDIPDEIEMLFSTIYRLEHDSLIIDAIGVLNTIAELSPDHEICRSVVNEMVRLYQKVGNAKGLIENLDNLIAKYPDNIVGIAALNYSVTVKAVSMEYINALNRSDRLLDLYSHNNGTNEQVAWALFEQGVILQEIEKQPGELAKSTGKSSNNIFGRILRDYSQSEAADMVREMSGGSIPELAELVIPKKFALKPAYPNPFNPVTQFGYAVPTKSQVRIDIYDLRGRLTETLVNQVKEPGNYQVTWNASEYPSGVYLYKIQAGTYTETKKCLLIK